MGCPPTGACCYCLAARTGGGGCSTEVHAEELAARGVWSERTMCDCDCDFAGSGAAVRGVRGESCIRQQLIWSTTAWGVV